MQTASTLPFACNPTLGLTLSCVQSANTPGEPADPVLNLLSGMGAITSDAAYLQVSHQGAVGRLLFDKGAAAKGRA